LADDFIAGPEMQMIRVPENHRRAHAHEVVGVERLHRRQGADRHECRRLDGTVRGREDTCARRGVGRSDCKVECHSGKLASLEENLLREWSMTDNKVWFITGCSTGFGRELAKLVLDRGYRAVITARELRSIEDLAAGREGRALALKLDVTNKVEVAEAVKTAQSTFGGIDVLGNNAGYGYVGAVEESEEDELGAMVDTNFFGLGRMIRAVLPAMRKRRHGSIVNISSNGGLLAFPGFGSYNATKFAVEGLSEALATEVAPLGIRVTIVEPGPFRTDFLGRSGVVAKTRIADYDATAGNMRKYFAENDGRQKGDPLRAVHAMMQVVESPNPPLRLLLGASALQRLRSKLASWEKEIAAWERVTLDADFLEGE